MPENCNIFFPNRLQVLNSVMRLSILCALLLVRSETQSQVIGNWNFNGSTTGTASTFNTVSVADFSSAVPSRAFNASTEYFGENGWPTGSLNPLHYLEFTLTPNTGYALNLSSITLRMRHSNTGPSGGSGPTAFNLRSSLDGFTSDLTSGVLTGAYVNFTITPGAAYSSLPTAITFRVYGHTAIVYTGGNNRLVFDNVQVTAIGLVLPLQVLYFKGTMQNGHVSLHYEANDVAAGTSFEIERSTDAYNFRTINTEIIGNGTAHIHNAFEDRDLSSTTGNLHYRLKTTSANGVTSYSEIVHLPGEASKSKLIVSYNRNLLHIENPPPGANRLILFNSAGGLTYQRPVNAGDKPSLNYSLPSLSPGIYYVILRSTTASRSAQIVITY